MEVDQQRTTRLAHRAEHDRHIDGNGGRSHTALGANEAVDLAGLDGVAIRRHPCDRFRHILFGNGSAIHFVHTRAHRV
jgi:hypothetical protein